MQLRQCFSWAKPFQLKTSQNEPDFVRLFFSSKKARGVQKKASRIWKSGFKKAKLATLPAYVKLRIHSITLCGITIQIVTHRVDWFSCLVFALLKYTPALPPNLIFSTITCRRPQVVHRWSIFMTLVSIQPKQVWIVAAVPQAFATSACKRWSLLECKLFQKNTFTQRARLRCFVIIYHCRGFICRRCTCSWRHWQSLT